jgi:hypothetical protein
VSEFDAKGGGRERVKCKYMSRKLVNVFENCEMRFGFLLLCFALMGHRKIAFDQNRCSIYRDHYCLSMNVHKTSWSLGCSLYCLPVTIVGTPMLEIMFSSETQQVLVIDRLLSIIHPIIYPILIFYDVIIHFGILMIISNVTCYK